METIAYASIYALSALFFVVALCVGAVFLFGEIVPATALGPRFPDKRPQKDPIPKHDKRPKKLYTPAEAMLVLNINLDALKKHIRNGKIRTFEDNGTLVLSAQDVRNLDKKAPKSSYPVVTSYDEDYIITNPVEFDA